MRALRTSALAAAMAALLGVTVLLPAAHADDASSTSAILAAVERDASHAKETASFVKRARDAMERATRLRAAGDETHARLADGLALENAEAARDLARTIDAERAADDARRDALDAGTRGDRERALLEEGIARNGRLHAQIDEVGRPVAETKTSRTASQIDAGAARTKGAAPKDAATKDGGAP